MTSPTQSGRLPRSQNQASVSRSTILVRGYTSIAQLRRLPLSRLKIDRTLVGALGLNAENPPIVSAVISFAHALGLSVTAEGIEQPHELEALVALGCDYGRDSSSALR